MIKNDYQNILDIFKKYNIEGYLNISTTNSKGLEYSPLHDEISLDNNETTTTSVYVIKNNKKASFKIDSYSLEKLENSIKDILKVIDFAETDKDIVLPNISDSMEKDFSNAELEKIDFEFLKNEFNKFKNFKFDEKITIETFSIGYSKSTHYYINSNGSFKTQIDNSSYYFYELFGQNLDKRETHYQYKSQKGFPVITEEDILETQTELLNKISENTNTISPGAYNVTLHKNVVIEFLDIILSNLGAENIREGISLFSKNKVGDKIFGNQFTLVNDPFLEGFTGNILFDGEGVTAKKTTLFKNGIFTSKFYNYKDALKEGLENLGNSTVTNIVLEAQGDKNYLKDSKFLFTNLMAFHTVDSSTGKFALNGEGYLIENGEKAGFVKNISLTGDIINLFSNIKAIGNDFREDGNFKIPSITFENQNII